MKKGWLWISIAVVVVVVLAVISGSGPDAQVDVVRLRTGTVNAYIEEQAVTELPQDYLISMPIAGWLERIDLREGDQVRKDEVVARLDMKDLQDRVTQAQKRIAVLDTKITKTKDHRLENHMLVDAEATVKAIDKTVEASEAKLEATLAVMEFAKTELDRLQKANEAEAVSPSELREVEMTYRTSRAEYLSDSLELAALKTLASVSYIGPQFVRDIIDRKSFDLITNEKQAEEAKADLEMELRNLGRAEIPSPIDGVVLMRHETRHQFLPAGAPLLTIGRMDDLEVIAEVLTQRATRIAAGDRVEIYGEAIPNGPLLGEVLRVYPAGFKKISSLGVEQQRVKVAIKLHTRPPRLGVAFRVHVRIFYDQAENASILPRTALFRGKKGTWQVMTVQDGHTAIRDVEIGLMNDYEAQVLSGISSEDLIVARPSHELKADMKVETLLDEPS